MLARADGFFQGGFGNLVYLLLFFSTLPLVVSLSDIHPAFEPSGINLLQESMGEAAKAAFPDYGGGFVLGSTDIPIRGVFTWSGVDWTTDIILKPLVFFGIAVCLMLVSSILFDRFDPASGRPGRTKTPAALPTNDAVTKV